MRAVNPRFVMDASTSPRPDQRARSPVRPAPEAQSPRLTSGHEQAAVASIRPINQSAGARSGAARRPGQRAVRGGAGALHISSAKIVCRFPGTEAAVGTHIIEPFMSNGSSRKPKGAPCKTPAVQLSFVVFRTSRGSTFRYGGKARASQAKQKKQEKRLCKHL